ncbi:MAG: hypothetical protein WAV04_02770 [Candidatus Microsaccharimonas sp.]
MKKLVITSLVASFVVLAGIFYSTDVSAQTTTTEPTQTVRCTIAQARLNTRITQVDKVKTAQTKVYNDLLARVDLTITSAEAASYDVSDLTAARNTASEAIQAFTTKSSEYTTSLMGTKNLSCGESGGEFVSSLVSTRKVLTETRQANLAIKTAFRNDVVPALQAYALWLKENTTTQEDK